MVVQQAGIQPHLASQVAQPNGLVATRCKEFPRDKLSLHQTAKRTGLSRNTIREWVRAPETTQAAYQRCATFNQLSPFHDTPEQALEADSFRAKHNRRSSKALFEQIKAEGYDGG